MHYRGSVRIAGRAGGTRLYEAREATPPQSDILVAMDTLVDVIVNKYAPLPERSLAELVGRLRSCTPQWAQECHAAVQRARVRLASAESDGVLWYWPAGENPRAKRWASFEAVADEVRLLAPFDPIVWDRRRFEILWNWAYRFEAYVPAAKRVRGYYAMPLLWRDNVIGWGNLAVAGNRLQPELGYVAGKAPREAAFKRAIDEELERLRKFLGLTA